MTSRRARSRSSPSSPRPKPKPGSASTEPRAREVPLAELKDDFSRYLRLAADQEIVITRHGRPAGVLVGFASEDDWFEDRLENPPQVARRGRAPHCAEARACRSRGSRSSHHHRSLWPPPPSAPIVVAAGGRPRGLM